MSRTMDAFNIKMSTFGGKHGSLENKQRNYDKFIAEKRGFIRTTNEYINSDPLKIVELETNPRVQRPGPAFECNYDNKYQQATAYATEAGRVK